MKHDLMLKRWGREDKLDKRFTFHFINKEYNNIYGFAIAEQAPNVNVSSNTFFIDEFNTSEFSFLKTYSKAELISAIDKAAACSASGIGLIATLNAISYNGSLYIDSSLNQPILAGSSDNIFFPIAYDYTRMLSIAGFVLSNKTVYDAFIHVINNYDECWIETYLDV